MFEVISEIFSAPVLVRALIVGILVSLCAALLGVSLVLKRFSMIGDGLSHVGFGALAVAAVMNLAPMAVAIPVVIVAAFLLLRLSSNSKTKGDSAIALISTSALAIGVMANSMSNGMNIDINSYLFGSIISVSGGDVITSVILALVVLIIFVFFYTKIFAITFDESFAKATGTNTNVYNMLIALLTAITIVIGMRLMGSMLISSLIIFPALCSMRVFKSFRAVTVCSAAISVVTFVVGMMISYIADTPCGASIVCVNIVVYAVFFVVGAVLSRSKKS
ncbi:MAG: metal ABC transporter permease [Oscillospiraceae bacterium]|nr:metal ABC transporter permease [Oscillospiraceae bacterium]